jgi:hypothetical protein
MNKQSSNYFERGPAPPLEPDEYTIRRVRHAGQPRPTSRASDEQQQQRAAR